MKIASVRPQGTASRRAVLAAVAASALTLAGRSGAAAQATPASAQGTPAAGEWSFTDDRGITVTLPKRPERVVAQVNSAAALWDYGVRPIAVFGPVLQADGAKEPTAGRIDLDAVELVSEGYDDPDLERLVALEPDLIVTTTWDPSVPDMVWGISPDAYPAAAAIAPMIVISIVDRSVLDVILRVQDLAAALGADVDAPEVVADRAAFADSEDAARAAIAGNPGLTTMFVAGNADGMYVCGPDYYIDLRYFADLGLDIVSPQGQDATDILSWEQADKYPADVIFNDYRSNAPFFRVDQLLEIPTFAALPAAKAGQIDNWYYEWVLSHRGFAFVLDNLAASVRGARADVV